METGLKFNVKAYDRTVRRIKGEAKRFEMDTPLQVIAKGDSGVLDNRIRDRTGKDVYLNPPCKTVGCHAGWTCVLNPEDTTIKGVRKNAALISRMNWDEIKPRATQILGITEDEANVLFHLWKWPEPYQSQYRNATTIKGHQRAALAYFAFFRKNKLAAERAEAKARKIEEKASGTQAVASGGC